MFCFKTMTQYTFFYPSSTSIPYSTSADCATMARKSFIKVYG